MHAFFRFFWPMSLISSRWACEVEPQVLAWVGCSKPSCFTWFWAGSGCGGLAGRRAWGALGASPGASGPSRGPLVPPRRTTKEALAAPGGLWRPLGLLGASGWPGRSPTGDSQGHWVCLLVCLFVCVCVCSFYKKVVNIRRFSVAHYKKVVGIRRFSISLYKQVVTKQW